MTEKTEDLVAEARRWANGHPNRRTGELMRDLAEALAALTTGQGIDAPSVREAIGEVLADMGAVIEGMPVASDLAALTEITDAAIRAAVSPPSRTAKRTGYETVGHAVGEHSQTIRATAALTTPQEHGWSTQNRRDAESEAESRWPIRGAETFATERDQIIFQQGCINGFILGAEWWNARTPRGSESLCYGADGATDPKCPACAGHGYGGTDYMNSGHCRACGGSGDAPQGGDVRERLDRVILDHVLKTGLPIPSYDNRRRALCSCGEALIYEGEYIALSWHRDHLANAILAALPVGGDDAE